MTSSASSIHVTVLRRLFVAGWLVLIASLFWDPYSAWLTTDSASFSPWRDTGEVVLVQGQVLPHAPYPVATQILWGVLVPLIPVGMMLFGQRAWGKVCPLSSLMQIPAKLGLQRRRAVPLLDPRRPAGPVATVPRGAWLARNHWYVQFGLLFCFLSGRLLFINADRMALGLFFLALIGTAVGVGIRYGGKTWCHYLCPMAPVQKIFSQPGPLLNPALAAAPAPAGSCPTVAGPKGEVVNCVGCTERCPDVTPESAYWNDLADPGRRFTYFGYFGLVLGFYAYYFLYSGNWDYYLSGAWTHTGASFAELMGPGFYLGGQPVAIPKLVAVPLTLGLFVLAANLLLSGLLRLLLWWRRGRGDSRRMLHRLFCVVVFATFNSYYLFSGRPTLRGLPEWVEPTVTVLLLAISSAWLVRRFRDRSIPA